MQVVVQVGTEQLDGVKKLQEVREGGRRRERKSTHAAQLHIPSQLGSCGSYFL